RAARAFPSWSQILSNRSSSESSVGESTAAESESLSTASGAVRAGKRSVANESTKFPAGRTFLGRSPHIINAHLSRASYQLLPNCQERTQSYLGPLGPHR